VLPTLSPYHYILHNIHILNIVTPQWDFQTWAHSWSWLKYANANTCCQVCIYLLNHTSAPWKNSKLQCWRQAHTCEQLVLSRSTAMKRLELSHQSHNYDATVPCSKFHTSRCTGIYFAHPVEMNTDRMHKSHNMMMTLLRTDASDDTSSSRAKTGTHCVAMLSFSKHSFPAR